MKEDFKKALSDSLPVMAGYIVLGIGFGIILKNAGYGFVVCILMSFCIYAGSMQYVTVSLLTSNVSLISAFIMTIVVNIRHLFYSISMLKRYEKMEKHKLHSIFLLTDETFSIVVNKTGESDQYIFLLSLMNQFYWVCGSILGNVFGDLIPFDTKGIEFSMTALFVSVVVDKWEENRNRDVIISGFVISIICLLFTGSTDFLLPSILLITLYLLVRKATVK